MTLVCTHCGDLLVAMDKNIATTMVSTFNGPCGQKHDDNCRTRVAWCARLHATWLSIRNRCTACDWIGRDHCATCGSHKLATWPDLPIGAPPALSDA